MVETIKQQAAVADAISKGDLTIDVTPRSDKDILGKSLKRLVDNNNKALGSVQESTMQVTIGAEQVANASQALAQGSTEQASALQQVTASINEIAEFLNVDSVDVILALEAIQDTISMSTPIYDNGGDVIELEDQIGGNDYITENWMRNNMIKEAFSKLSKREQAIIYDRYYLDKTQMEIALELSISQAQVSRLEKNALKIMYDYMR